MRKLILKWLLGNVEIKTYWDLFQENIKIREEHIKTLEEHIKALNKHQQTLELAQESVSILERLLKVCKEHGIDVDEELET